MVWLGFWIQMILKFTKFPIPKHSFICSTSIFYVLGTTLGIGDIKADDTDMSLTP